MGRIAQTIPASRQQPIPPLNTTPSTFNLPGPLHIPLLPSLLYIKPLSVLRYLREPPIPTAASDDPIAEPLITPHNEMSIIARILFYLFPN